MDKPTHSISVYSLENNSSSRMKVQFLLVNNEEIELSFSGNSQSFWLTNKRIILLSNDELTGKIETYHSYAYANILSFSAKINEIFRAFLDINIQLNQIETLHIELHKSLPVKEIAQLLSSKILQ
jgi:hypothetical protein